MQYIVITNDHIIFKYILYYVNGLFFFNLLQNILI